MRDINNNFDDFMAFLAEAGEPMARIAADPAVASVFRENKPVIALLKPLLGSHKDDVAVIAAAVWGVSPDEFREKFSAADMIGAVMKFLASSAVKEVFPSAEQKTGAASSGSAWESTGE